MVLSYIPLYLYKYQQFRVKSFRYIRVSTWPGPFHGEYINHNHISEWSLVYLMTTFSYLHGRDKNPLNLNPEFPSTGAPLIIHK